MKPNISKYRRLVQSVINGDARTAREMINPNIPQPDEESPLFWTREPDGQLTAGKFRLTQAQFDELCDRQTCFIVDEPFDNSPMVV